MSSLLISVGIGTIALISLLAYKFSITDVPNGFMGFDGTDTYPEGRHHSPYHIRLIDMHARVTAATSVIEAGKSRRLLITWRPDKLNLAVFERNNPDAELKRLVSTLPHLDLPHHAKLLGIELLKVEDNAPPKTDQRGGVSLGDDVEIPY